MKLSTLKGTVWIVAVIALLGLTVWVLTNNVRNPLVLMVLTILMAYVYMTNYWDRIQKTKQRKVGA
jgi:hypothetical protein